MLWKNVNAITYHKIVELVLDTDLGLSCEEGENNIRLLLHGSSFRNCTSRAETRGGVGRGGAAPVRCGVRLILSPSGPCG